MLTDDQSIWQHNPSSIYMWFVTVVMSGSFYCSIFAFIWGVSGQRETPKVQIYPKFLYKSQNIFFPQSLKLTTAV